MPNLLPLFALTCSASSALAGQSVISESFDDGSNLGGWSFGAPGDVIEKTGGNPGAYLHNDFVDSFGPTARTTEDGSPFTGDLRDAGVTAIGVDVIVHDVDFSAAERPLALILVSDNGTPGDFNDDWGAWTISEQFIPVPGEGWRSFDFQVDAAADELPAGWGIIQFGPDSPSDPQWSDLVMNVTQTQFLFAHPEFFYIFQGWNVGIDNPRITVDAGTVGDIDGDGSVGFSDLLILLSAWGPCEAGGDCPADLDGNGSVDFTDLLTLLTHWS